MSSNSSKTNIKIHSVSLMLKKLLCAFVGYFNGKMYHFVLDSDNNLSLTPSLLDKKTPLAVIVARRCYQEKACNYPLENNAELKKMLELEHVGEENSYFHIWGSNDGHSQVNIWRFNSTNPAAMIQIPESLLFALTASTNQITQFQSIDNANKNLFVARSGDLVHSLQQTSVINSSQRFAMSVGVAKLEADKLVEPDDFAAEIGRSVKHFSFALLKSFIRLPKKELRFALLTDVVLPLLLILTCYLAIGSGYLAYKHYSLSKSIASQAHEISGVLEWQQTFDSQFDRYSQLKDFLSSIHTTSSLWLVVAELLPKAELSNIRINEGRYVLRGETTKAVELLELISRNPLVRGAKFDFPTRTSRQSEVFVISFELVDGRNSFSEMENMSLEPGHD